MEQALRKHSLIILTIAALLLLAWFSSDRYEPETTNFILKPEELKA